jgi:two-component system, NtrC family, response regulator HydG
MSPLTPIPGTPSVPQPLPKGRILVVDDQRNMRATTAMLLRSEGYTVLEASTGEEALGVLSGGGVDLLLTDLKMEPMDGLTLLKRGMETSPRLQAIVMTAFGSIESAVEAMRLGAYDYVTKPFKEGELRYRVERALERAKLLSAVDLFAGEFNQRHGLSSLVGRSAAMRELTGRLLRVAQSDATVLIQGESGTGKELVARALHTHSRRKARPFVPVNCAAISESLLESELFGHAKGAFTGATHDRPGLFEAAHGGTLFLDEVGEVPLAMQAKLLRTLQEREVRRVGENQSRKVDVRILAATHRNLLEEVAAGRFRQDLYYRLRVIELKVPALRERREDLLPLARMLLAEAAQRLGRKVSGQPSSPQPPRHRRPRAGGARPPAPRPPACPPRARPPPLPAPRPPAAAAGCAPARTPGTPCPAPAAPQPAAVPLSSPPWSRSSRPRRGGRQR